MLNLRTTPRTCHMKMRLKKSKTRNPMAGQLRNWYQRIIKNKKKYNRNTKQPKEKI